MAEIEQSFLALVNDPDTVANPREVQMAIMQRILGADDFDAALDMADIGALSTEDLAEVPFTIDEIGWHKGAEAYRENSVGVFALLALTLLDDAPYEGGPTKGTQVAMTTGSHNVLAVLKKGVDARAVPDTGQTPRRVFRFKGNQTARGTTAYWLARAGWLDGKGNIVKDRPTK